MKKHLAHLRLSFRFLLAFLISLTISLQGNPVMAAKKIYTEKQLRALGIYFVGRDFSNTTCDANAPNDAVDTEDPTVDNNYSSAISADSFTTPEAKIEQTFIIGFSDTDPALVKKVVQKYHPGGVIIQGHTDDKIFNKTFFASLNGLAGTPLIVAVDQEGGQIQHYDATTPVGNQPSAKAMGAMDTSAVEQIGKITGLGLAGLGVNVDLAPVLDIDNGTNSISTKERSFSSDPNVIIDKASAFAQGLNEGGIKPVFKHFPGHGNASGTGDSDDGVVTTPSLDTLKTSDLIPYQQLTNKFDSAVMLGNLNVPGLTEPNTPTSLSPATVSLLRNNYGFTGMITTDDLNVPSVSTQGHPLPNAISTALAAGVDAPLFSYTNDTDIDNAISQAKANVPAERIDAALASVLSFKNTNPLFTASAPAAAPVTTAPGGLKTGSNVYIMGDSITAMSASAYVKNFADRGITATVDGSSSRSIKGAGVDGNKLSGLDAIETDKDAIAKADAVVIALGTNGGENLTTVDAAFDAVRKYTKTADIPIYWVDTITVGRPDYLATKTSNVAIYNEASAKGYTIISWAKVVDPNSTPATLTGNEADTNGFILPYANQDKKHQDASLGVHPTANGITALTTRVGDAVTIAHTTSVQTASGCCNVSTPAPTAVDPSGAIVGTFYGGQKTLPDDWKEPLKAAGNALHVDPAFLAAILGVETGWTPLAAFVQNPELDHHPGGAAGAFEFEPGTAATYRNKPEVVDALKHVADEKNPVDAAYMAAALLKDMGATLDIKIGDDGDYGYARNNSDGKVTVRTIAAHYNQGGAASMPNGTSLADANGITKAKNGNRVGDYMDMVSSNTAAIRATGLLAADGSAPTSAADGCGDSTARDPKSDTEFTVYSQTDPQWQDNQYGTNSDGTKSTIKISGAGPTAMAMIITFLSGSPVTPADTAAYGITAATEDKSGGSVWDIATIEATHWNLTATAISNDASLMNDYMGKGALIILAGKGTTAPWTTGGNFIVIRGVTEGGKWRIGDPNLAEDNTKEFDPAEVLKDASPGSAYAITKPATAAQTTTP